MLIFQFYTLINKKKIDPDYENKNVILKKLKP
jgi:hypothetical protein